MTIIQMLGEVWSSQERAAEPAQSTQVEVEQRIWIVDIRDMFDRFSEETWTYTIYRLNMFEYIWISMSCYSTDDLPFLFFSPGFTGITTCITRGKRMMRMVTHQQNRTKLHRSKCHYQPVVLWSKLTQGESSAICRLQEVLSQLKGACQSLHYSTIL